MTTDLTPAEIAVRERVYAASQNGRSLRLMPGEVKALAESILKTGREICILRAEIEGEPVFKLTAPKLDA